MFSDQSLLLARAVLGAACADDRQAMFLLTEAADHRVDPFDFFCHRLALDPADVWQAAAIWAQYGFSLSPATSDARVVRDRTDPSIARARIEADAGNIVFYSPTFEHVLALAALRSTYIDRAQRFVFVPPAVFETACVKLLEAELLSGAIGNTAQRWPTACALLSLTLDVRLGFAVLFFGLAALLVLSGSVSFLPAIPLVVLLLNLPGTMRLLALMSRSKAHAHPPLPDADLPVYSIMVPLRDEAGMVPQLCGALRALDYPPDKLDVHIVVESTSAPTVAAVERELHDPRFCLTIVPEAGPATKPKALNFALPLLRGSFVVVYDAEDVPDPGQLRAAASYFASEPGIDCLQAELVAENASETWLTALFAGEYAGLFGCLLPALIRWNLPVPLGGTSNHFRIETLRAIGGWDAYNVTEDADLGVRLRRIGARVGMLDSVTHEEAPVHLGAWMRQRTRWMKGWMQTAIVHNRNIMRLGRDLGWPTLIGFELLISSMMLTGGLHMVFIAMLLIKLVMQGASAVVPHDLAGWLMLALLVPGYAGAAGLVVRGLWRRRLFRLLPFVLLLPVYWLLLGVSCFRALGQLIIAPHYWAKTTHGLTRIARRSVTG